MKTYKTGEMIIKLEENPQKEFIRTRDGLVIRTDEKGYLVWEGGHNWINLGDEWEEVKKPVDFITAVKSGKHVGVEYSAGVEYRGVKYGEMSLPDLFYELQQDYSDKTIRQMILNGKWYIKD